MEGKLPYSHWSKVKTAQSGCMFFNNSLHPFADIFRTRLLASSSLVHFGTLNTMIRRQKIDCTVHTSFKKFANSPNYQVLPDMDMKLSAETMKIDAEPKNTLFVHI